MINGPRTLSTLAVATIGLSLGAPTAAAEEPEWIRQFGTGTADQATATAAAADGSVYVLGVTYGSFRGPSKGDYDAFLSKFDRDGNEVWRRQPGSSSFEWAYGVATDTDGNLYAVGYTYGSLGGPKHGGDGDQDAWVIKFDRDGRHIWDRQPGSGSNDWATGVATDPDGNIYVVGNTLGSLGGPKRGDADAWLIKFDRDGRSVWKRQPGSSSHDRATAVGTDAAGHVYVVGYTYGSLGGPNKGDSDAFVITFDGDGRQVWKRQPGTARADYGFGVAIDADGGVYVAGETWGSLGGPNKGLRDAFVIKFDRDGRHIWDRQPGSGRPEGAHDVATDTDGTVYLVGSSGYVDPFVIAIDRGGRYLWRSQPGTTEWEEANGVATDADGNLYVAGTTAGLIGDSRKGNYDAFLIKYPPGAAE